MFKLRFLTVALVAAGVLTLPVLGHARDAEADAAAAPADGAAAEAAPAKDNGKLQEVIVTAQKRRQSSSKVALSLAVVSADEIKDKGVTSAAGLTDLAPNVHIGAGNFNSMEIVIRGIGSSLNSELGDPESAFHVDGIYLGRPQGATAAFFDLERVEILRGPQGTLYGRNANAGAINLISKRPVNKLEGLVDTELGNYSSRKVSAMLNVPINDALAVRAVVAGANHDGYTKGTYNASDVSFQDDLYNRSARVSAQLTLSPTASWLVIANTSETKGTGPTSFPLANGVVENDRETPLLVPGHVDDQTSGITSELKVGLGAVDMTYLYGYQSADTDEKSGVKAANLFYHIVKQFKQDSHELRFSSATPGALQWVAGAYYFKEEGYIDQSLNLIGLPSSIGLPAVLNARLAGSEALCAPAAACFEVKRYLNGPTISSSKALFGQATYSMTPELRVVLGLRTNTDAKSREGKIVNVQGLKPAGINSAAVKASKLTYKLGVEYDLSAAQMAYATLSTGYNSGGFNDGNQISPTTPGYSPALYYRPETITALEGGLKGRFLDGKLRMGLSAFYYDYSNLQVASVINLVLTTLNAAKAKVKGFELDGVALVAPDSRVNFGLGLLSAKYDQYLTAGGTDYSGHTLDRAPKATLTLGFTHDWTLDNDQSVSAYIGSHYSAAYTVTDPGNSGATVPYGAVSFKQPSFTKTDVVLTWAGADARWQLQLFGKNLEDKRAIASMTTISAAAENVFLSEPRTFGLRASYKFLAGASSAPGI